MELLLQLLLWIRALFTDNSFIYRDLRVCTSQASQRLSTYCCSKKTFPKYFFFSLLLNSFRNFFSKLCFYSREFLVNRSNIVFCNTNHILYLMYVSGTRVRKNIVKTRFMVVNKYRKVIFAQAEGGDTHAQDCWIQFEVCKKGAAT